MSRADILANVAREIATTSLEIGAIKLRAKDPFTWASGYRMPVYNDNRMLLGYPRIRKLIAQGMQEIISISGEQPGLIAGTATAGIPAATSLADALMLPLVYVRAKPKDHGMQNLVEGQVSPGVRTVLVEDLFSTGGSAINAVHALRSQGAEVTLCLAVFSYEFEECAKKFREVGCEATPLLTFSRLLELAQESGAIGEEERELLADWRSDPFNWAERNFGASSGASTSLKSGRK